MRRDTIPHHTTVQGHYPIVFIRWLQPTEIGLYLRYLRMNESVTLVELRALGKTSTRTEKQPVTMPLCTGLFKMIVGVLTTCHKQYT